MVGTEGELVDEVVAGAELGEDEIVDEVDAGSRAV